METNGKVSTLQMVKTVFTTKTKQKHNLKKQKLNFKKMAFNSQFILTYQ